MSISRRNFVATTVAAPLASAQQTSGSEKQPTRLRVVFTGGHPGDPECGCAGTIARYAALGHDVVLLYMNRGEGFCQGADPSQCGVVRTQEAINACKILKARAVFNDQIDGKAVIDNAHYASLQHLLSGENPDIVFLQWPIDSHRDHRGLSNLVLDAWLQSKKSFALYYYEVAEDTMMFSPMEFVDISDPHIESLRRAACYAHASQAPEKWFPLQTELTHFRGVQSGHGQAEAFLRHWESKSAFLP